MDRRYGEEVKKGEREGENEGKMEREGKKGVEGSVRDRR